MRTLHWLGQEHANYTMGLFAPDAAATFTAADISHLAPRVGASHGGSCGCPQGTAVHLGRHPETLRQAAASACAEQWLCRQTWRLNRALRAPFQQTLPTHARPQGEKARWNGQPDLWLGRDARRKASDGPDILCTESPAILRHGYNEPLQCPPAPSIARSLCSKATIPVAFGSAISGSTTRSWLHSAARAVTTACHRAVLARGRRSMGRYGQAPARQLHRLQAAWACLDAAAHSKTSRYVWPVAQNLRARLFGRPGRPNADWTAATRSKNLDRGFLPFCS